MLIGLLCFFVGIGLGFDFLKRGEWGFSGWG